MKKFLIFLILVFSGSIAFGQNIRIQQLRSTGEPAGRIVVTDGSGSFQFGDESFSSVAGDVGDHLDNDNDLSPTNELIDSMRVDGSVLKIYEGGNSVPNSLDLDSLFAWETKIDSIFMENDTLLFYQGGDTIPYKVTVDFTNYWSKTEITTADTTRWGDSGTDDQTAAEVTYSNTTSGLTATDVQAAIDEIDGTVDGIISTGGDGWGVDVVNSDITLTGDGTSGNVLKVDTTLIPTYTQMRGEISDSITGLSSGGNGITALTGEVTASGTGSVVATVSDNVIDYGNVDETLKSSTTNNTLTWDISANGIIFCTPSSGTVSFSNYQVNKSITVVLTLSGATISWPASAKILEGSATLEDGTFYVYIHCISSSIFTVSITKEAS